MLNDHREMNFHPIYLKKASIVRAVLMLSASSYPYLKYVQNVFLFFIALSTIALFMSPHFSVSEAGTMDLDFGKDDLSATIEQSALKAVIEKITEKQGIWIKGAENLEDETYSVEFEGVTIREAIERMLEPFNCCYFIDEEGGLVGIIVLSKKDKRGVTRKRSIPRNVFQRSRRR